MSQREILFKAKTIFNGMWVDGYIVKFAEDNWYIKNTDGEETTSWRCDPKTVCQYTGLADKNGNKIFENDIVSYRYEKMIIEYNEDVAAFMMIMENGWRISFITASAENVEIIGNIHDTE